MVFSRMAYIFQNGIYQLNEIISQSGSVCGACMLSRVGAKMVIGTMGLGPQFFSVRKHENNSLAPEKVTGTTVQKMPTVA